MEPSNLVRARPPKGNYAVSGSIEGCEAVEKLGKSFKARMTVRSVFFGGGGAGDGES
jgi:hypothetical protein